MVFCVWWSSLKLDSFNTSLGSANMDKDLILLHPDNFDLVVIFCFAGEHCFLLIPFFFHGYCVIVDDYIVELAFLSSGYDMWLLRERERESILCVYLFLLRSWSSVYNGWSWIPAFSLIKQHENGFPCFVA